MSFDAFLQGFSKEPLDAVRERIVRELVEPSIESREPGCVRLITGDGGADVYGCRDGPIDGFMVNHAHGREVWDLVHRVATVAAFADMPAGCGTLLPPGFDRSTLPDGVPEPIVKVESGADIITAIERG